jgi:hypothetical protein
MNISVTIHQFPVNRTSNPAAPVLPDNDTTVPTSVAPARVTTPTLIDVSRRSSFISAFAYQGTTDGLGFLALFFKNGRAALYRGVPPTIPGLLAAGHTNAISDGELSVGATFSRLVRGKYESQTFDDPNQVKELKKLMQVGS